MAFLLVLMADGTQAARAQSALDGFDPNANGQVRVFVVQPDGKILIGGDFTTLSPNGGVAVTRNRIARLNPDGTLDAAFDPNAGNAGSQVFSIALQADGKILAGGSFISIGGQTRNRIARLDPVTGLADTFNPNANANVYSIAVQADGRVLAGGQFTNIGGQTRFRIARLDAVTGAADSFSPDANNVVYSIVVQPDGKILIGGTFNTVSFTTVAVTRNNIARIDAVTGAADSFDPNANGAVYSIAVQADGKVLVGGNFGFVNGLTSRAGIARLDRVTGLADSFNPRTQGGGGVNSIVVQQDGKILAGGDFTTLSPNGGAAVTRNSIARLETGGLLDRTLDLGIVPAGGGVSNVVLATAVQPDGKILIGGGFITVLGVTRNNIARLNPDGTLDTAFNPNANSDVLSIAVQADGKILVGGYFNGANSIGGQARNRIARLDLTT
ncbi:MAG: hypothetical protein M3Y82_15090, partial [Verrucomicrobiota bacterium]|nr:hypothetical protein [Verrucomicrobiota bacterium]